jgi:hypothetical protein
MARKEEEIEKRLRKDRGEKGKNTMCRNIGGKEDVENCEQREGKREEERRYK